MNASESPEKNNFVIMSMQPLWSVRFKMSWNHAQRTLLKAIYSDLLIISSDLQWHTNVLPVSKRANVCVKSLTTLYYVVRDLQRV